MEPLTSKFNILELEDTYFKETFLSILIVSLFGIAPLNSELGNLLDKYGIRLASEDSEEMSNAIIKIIEDKKFRYSLSNKGKMYIERFYEKENVLNNMYEEVKNQISLG